MAINERNTRGRVDPDLAIGQRFNELNVIGAPEFKESSRHRFYLCRCICGNERLVRHAHLISGHTKSCGCIRRTRQAGPLTVERVRELLDYDPLTGIFKWRVSINGWIIKGRQAGAPMKAGKRPYLRLMIDGHASIMAHRLAWFYVHGVWPSVEIDHIDGDPQNNRIANLRDVSRSVNVQNRRGPARHNRTGFLGVSKTENGNYAACIGVNGKTISLGRYDTPEEAYAVYVAAKRRLHEGCTI